MDRLCSTHYNRRLGRLGVLALAALSIASVSKAQIVPQVVGGSEDGRHARVLLTDNTGRLQVVGAAAGGSVFGNNANGAAPTQPPVFIAGWDGTLVRSLLTDTTGHLVVNMNAAQTIAASQSGTWTNTVTQPTAASLNATVVQSGVWTVQPGNTANTTAWLFRGGITASDALSPTNMLATYSLGGLYNGTTVNANRDVIGATAGTGIGVEAVSVTPNSSANISLTPVVSTALESGHVFKASAGNLYRLRVTATIAGYVLESNSTTVPADGAVTPQSCTQVNAGTTEIDHTIPDRFTVGISVSFSTTGCFTKTASVSAMFEGSVQ